MKKSVNALNGLSSFLHFYEEEFDEDSEVCQRPERAFFISTFAGLAITVMTMCVNALNGLSSFLRYPLKPRINTGFPASFLQVFA